MTLAKRILQSGYLTSLMCLALIIVSCLTTPGFATQGNASNILSAAAPLLIVALGQMLVMIGGGIDLSQTAIMAGVSVGVSKLVASGHDSLDESNSTVLLMLVAMPLLGTTVGLLNGIAIAWLKMPPFIVTLTGMMYLYGLATWITHSANIGGLPRRMTVLGASPWFGFIVASVLSTIVALSLKRTIYGRWLYAVGENRDTSLVSGVPVSQVLVATYAASGLMAGIAAFIFTAQLETGSPVLGKNMLLDIIGAVVIGGTSLFGGKGKVAWTIGGVFLLAILDNVLNLQSLSHFSVMIAKGTLILAAAVIDAAQRRWSER